MSWIAAGITVATTVGGAVYNSSQAKKAKRSNDALLSSAEKAGAFRALAIPKPQMLNVPSAESILGAWRGDVNKNFGAYDAIAGNLNDSEQAAARTANQAANPQYYEALNQMTQNALSASRGELPSDVKQNILRQANEDAYLRGFSYGTPGGSGAATYAGGNDAGANLALRNLGLTSLDMMKYGNQLSGQVLDQSRASRGTVMSAKDTVPTTDIFGNQMNAAAVAAYNYETDKAGYDAARKNAPIQAAYNKLSLQMGVQQQNNALSSQVSSNNAQLAMSALQALGGMYTGGGTIGAGKSVSNAPASYGASTGFSSGGGYMDFAGATQANGMWYNSQGTPISDAASITSIRA